MKKLSDVEAALTLNDSLPEVTLSGEVKAVCQKKGCWMTLNSSNGNRVRVTFKDYGFFVPKDLSGSVVTIKGVVKSEELSTEMDQHYAEDEGRAFDPEADLREISIVASGVTVTSKMN
ncbi:DUF4920 domain-containing protein [Marinoscillum furvescens]|uniref:DUF4920 domain-containing protein n=1 Tax=Marinoscillum furvescens TaxID=1026 RepID=UPI001FE99DBE|nr:DUF4920 domain-containing protein [Marinoscillum furvescens]